MRRSETYQLAGKKNRELCRSAVLFAGCVLAAAAELAAQPATPKSAGNNSIPKAVLSPSPAGAGSRSAFPAQITAFAKSAPGLASRATAPARLIVVSIPDRKLALLVNGRVVKVFSVAVGKPSTPSPSGVLYIADRVMNPTYYRPGVVIPPGPHDPVGTRWLGLSKHGYGIHGTDEPRSIGRAVSHGCVRLHDRDVEALFPLVHIGDEVVFFHHRDAFTAALFHSRASVQPVLADAAYHAVAAH